MDTESIPSDPGAVLEADLVELKCPTCTEPFMRKEDLERHRERHLPLAKRTKGSIQCPKRCGRWLVSHVTETTSHIALCDGQKPIRHKPIVRRWVCEEHNYETTGAKGWGLHKKAFHNGEDPRPKKTTDNIEQAVELLKKKKAALLQEIERLDSAIKILVPDPGIQA